MGRRSVLLFAVLGVFSGCTVSSDNRRVRAVSDNPLVDRFLKVNVPSLAVEASEAESKFKDNQGALDAGIAANLEARRAFEEQINSLRISNADFYLAADGTQYTWIDLRRLFFQDVGFLAYLNSQTVADEATLDIENKLKRRIDLLKDVNAINRALQKAHQKVIEYALKEVAKYADKPTPPAITKPAATGQPETPATSQPSLEDDSQSVKASALLAKLFIQQLEALQETPDENFDD